MFDVGFDLWLYVVCSPQTSLAEAPMPRSIRRVIWLILLLLLLALLTPALPARSQGVCPGAQPIAAARQQAIDTTVTVRGVVTVPTGAFNTDRSFALQDDTGGLYVFRTEGIGQVLSVGDEVCVTGRLAEYHGLLELMPRTPAQVVRLGSAVVPAPVAVTPKTIGKANEGLLIKTTGTVSGVGDRRFRLDGAVVYVYATTGISLAGVRDGCRATVTGLSGNYEGPQLLPRLQADIVLVDCPAEPQPTPVVVCPDVTVAQIQGPGMATIFDADARFRCLDACVTGVSSDGFYVQSLAPDADPRTSEGIYVYRFGAWENPRGLAPGARVTLRNFGVQEFYGETEIVKLSDDTEASYTVTGRCDLPAAVPVPPLVDPGIDPTTLYEPFEGMRVSLSFAGSVVGPTARYASRYPAGDPEITLADEASPFYGQRILATQLPASRGTIALSGGLGVDLPNVGIFDLVSAQNLTGVLAFRFDRWTLLVDDPAPLRVQDLPDPTDPEPPLGPEVFGLCSFNAENLFDAVNDMDGDSGDWSPADAETFRAWVVQRGRVIQQQLPGCTVVGLQEVEGKDAVWAALAQAAGPRYRYDYFESMDTRDITVGILYDAERVQLRSSDQPQRCGRIDYQVNYAYAIGTRARPNPCAAGSYPLFDRPPYVADLTIRDAAGTRALDVRVIVVHLKSKRGDETANLPRRVAQANFVAGLLTASNSVALGDFNDTLGSQPLTQFPGAVNLWQRYVAPADRYTYIYQGRAEAIDHFVMTSGLDAHFLAGGPVHINADFPDTRTSSEFDGRSSDHDPLFVRFAFQPTVVSAALIGAVMGTMQR